MVGRPLWKIAQLYCALSFFNMVAIGSQRQAAGPSYLRIAKRAATL
jgi:hypothetical protein